MMAPPGPVPALAEAIRFDMDTLLTWVEPSMAQAALYADVPDQEAQAAIASHSPALSMPSAVADIIEEIVWQ